jgi:peptide/nickel transport system permease protein
MFIRYIIKRILLSIPVLLLITILVFSVIHLVPGDPITVMIGSHDVPAETINLIKAQYNLDKPIAVQYFLWIKGVLKGDLGISIVQKEPVIDLIKEKLPVTFALAITSIIIAVIIAVVLGVIAAYKRNTVFDFGSMSVALLGISIPPFWLGIMLILLFALILGLLPSVGYVPLFEDPVGFLRHIILPAGAVGFINAGYLTRVTRNQMLEVLNQDYIRTARSKGIKEVLVLYNHAFRNALITLITAIGIRFAYLMGGTVINEQIFAIPGIGRLALNAIINKDYPVVQGVVLVSAVIFVLINLIVDILYTLLDPRIRLK